MTLVPIRLTLADDNYDRLLCDYMQARGGRSMTGATFASDLDELLSSLLGEDHSLVLHLDIASGEIRIPQKETA